MDRDEELRAWAKGSYPAEAAVELLLRAFNGRFAGSGHAWVRTDDRGRHWIDFEAVPEHIGGLSGGEKRFLGLVASMGGTEPVVLGDVLSGLDRDVVDLILAAVAHSTGSHEGVVITHHDDTVSMSRPGSLYPWPELPRRLHVVDDGS
jgi:hypothetical protein